MFQKKQNHLSEKRKYRCEKQKIETAKLRFLKNSLVKKNTGVIDYNR